MNDDRKEALFWLEKVINSAGTTSGLAGSAIWNAVVNKSEPHMALACIDIALHEVHKAEKALNHASHCLQKKNSK